MEKPIKSASDYSPLEEKLNVWTHGFGFVLSVVGLLFLSFRESVTPLTKISLIVFGVSMCLLYAASTAYHRAKAPIKRARLKIFDHAAIYILIAGTYTPLVLVVLPKAIGWWLFGIVWSIALLGVLLKLFYTGRFDILSTLLYVAMGWIIVFAYKPLLASFDPLGVQWLFEGGILYTIGAVFYSISKIPLNHATFHIFVLGGTFCHFMSVYFYVQ